MSDKDSWKWKVTNLPQFIGVVVVKFKPNVQVEKKMKIGLPLLFVKDLIMIQEETRRPLHRHMEGYQWMLIFCHTGSQGKVYLVYREVQHIGQQVVMALFMAFSQCTDDLSGCRNT